MSGNYLSELNYVNINGGLNNEGNYGLNDNCEECIEYIDHEIEVLLLKKHD